MNKAIYRPTVFPERQETLVYNKKDGFSWVRLPNAEDPVSEWYCYASTVVEAERLAREAGHDPQAVYYIQA